MGDRVIHYVIGPSGNPGIGVSERLSALSFTHDGTRLVAAITITGDAVCRATNVVYRLDKESARQFLAPFVTLP
jgi:hypothetical protein